jgi:hypothetical protein
MATRARTGARERPGNERVTETGRHTETAGERAAETASVTARSGDGAGVAHSPGLGVLDAGPSAARLGRRLVDPWSFLLGTVVVLVISVPLLMWAESGPVPMIDNSTDEWLLPAGFVLLAFVLGGALAARRCRSWAGLAHGIAVGGLCAALLLIGDLVRRASVHKAVSTGVEHLWYIGIVAAIAAGLGGALASLVIRWAFDRS